MGNFDFNDDHKSLFRYFCKGKYREKVTVIKLKMEAKLLFWENSNLYRWKEDKNIYQDWGGKMLRNKKYFSYGLIYNVLSIYAYMREHGLLE